MIFSLVAMTGLEKCCITSAYLQWLCHSGKWPVARGPLVVKVNTCSFFIEMIGGSHVWILKKMMGSHDQDVSTSRNVRKCPFWLEHPAKIQISLRIRAVWSESSLSAFWITKEAIFLHAYNEDWSDCADEEAVLSQFVRAHVRRYASSRCGSYGAYN